MEGRLLRLLRALQDHGIAFILVGGLSGVLQGAGWLDVLGAIGHGQGYEELLAKSHEMEIAEGLRIRVLDLEAYIEIKEAVGSEKNLAVLPILRQTLRERERLR